MILSHRRKCFSDVLDVLLPFWHFIPIPNETMPNHDRYFSGDGYLESDTHVGSSVIAARIVGVCRGYTRNFSTNVALVLQVRIP